MNIVITNTPTYAFFIIIINIVRFVDSQFANGFDDDDEDDDDDNDNDNNHHWQVCGWPARQRLRSRLLCHFKHLTELPHGYCQVRGILCLLGICFHSTFVFWGEKISQMWEVNGLLINIGPGKTSQAIASLIIQPARETRLLTQNA